MRECDKDTGSEKYGRKPTEFMRTDGDISSKTQTLKLAQYME